MNKQNLLVNESYDRIALFICPRYFIAAKYLQCTKRKNLVRGPCMRVSVMIFALFQHDIVHM